MNQVNEQADLAAMNQQQDEDEEHRISVSSETFDRTMETPPLKRAADGGIRTHEKKAKTHSDAGQGSCEGHTATRPGAKRAAKDSLKFPVEPATITVVKKPRTVMNHSYRDFSCVPPEITDEIPTDISAMTFSQKVHDILCKKEFMNYIAWMSHGRAFRVIIPKRFEQKVSQKYFGHSRYSSFLRQLNNYGFKHISQGSDRNCYYHECFLRGLPHLCKYMPAPKNARRLIPDPENEPDFYMISKHFPLPDQEGVSEATSDGLPSEDDKKPAALPVATNNDIDTASKESTREVDMMQAYSHAMNFDHRMLPSMHMPGTMLHLSGSGFALPSSSHLALGPSMHFASASNLHTMNRQRVLNQSVMDGNPTILAALAGLGSNSGMHELAVASLLSTSPPTDTPSTHQELQAALINRYHSFQRH